MVGTNYQLKPNSMNYDDEILDPYTQYGVLDQLAFDLWWITYNSNL